MTISETHHCFRLMGRGTSMGPCLTGEGEGLR